MQGPSLQELRELSTRSRRAQRWGFFGFLGALLLVPAQLMLASRFAAEWLALASLLAGGALLLRYAYLAGEERGAFRKVFRRLADERRTRTLVPEAPAAPLTVSVETR